MAAISGTVTNGISQKRTEKMQNRAVVISGVDEIDIKPWPLKIGAYSDSALYDEAGPLPAGTVLLHVRASGICGSDVCSWVSLFVLDITLKTQIEKNGMKLTSKLKQIHFWKEGGAGPDRVKEPFVVGHESAGEIIKVAPDVTAWALGDRIAVKPGFPCLR